jgi:hypothetical protein
MQKIIGVIIALIFSITIAIASGGTPSVEDLKKKEVQARIDREKAEDKESTEKWEKCYKESLTMTGMRFHEKQKQAYSCWKSTNS